MTRHNKRPLTPSYLAFYVLFSPDTWRILIGCIVSFLLTPRIVQPEVATAGRVVLYVMVAGIGWAVGGKPAAWLATGLKRAILGTRKP